MNEKAEKYILGSVLEKMRLAGCDVREYGISHLVPSRKNQAENLKEFCITVKYVKP